MIQAGHTCRPIALQTTQALEAARGKGIVHEDLKQKKPIKIYKMK